MQCNIDARGRRARMISGTICCVAAVIIAGIAFFRVEILSLLGVIALGLLAIGAFQIFEGKKGWCVMRAVGIKTRI